MKPKISRAWIGLPYTAIDLRCWQCDGDGHGHYGLTPEDAYAKWAKSQARRAAQAGENACKPWWRLWHLAIGSD
jgi:hypothetical protein